MSLDILISKADRIFHQKMKYGISIHEAKRAIAKEDLMEHIKNAETLEDLKEILLVVVNETIKP